MAPAGELLFFGASTLAPPYCAFGRADAAGGALGSVEVPLQQAVLMHDFAITERYAVFIDGSLVMDTAVSVHPFGYFCHVYVRCYPITEWMP